jgi:hypothetical protein
MSVIRHSCKVLMTIAIYQYIFRKKNQILNYMKILPLGAELCQADGRTEGHRHIKKLTVAFNNFENAPKIRKFTPRC